MLAGSKDSVHIRAISPQPSMSMKINDDSNRQNIITGYAHACLKHDYAKYTIIT